MLVYQDQNIIILTIARKLTQYEVFKKTKLTQTKILIFFSLFMSQSKLTETLYLWIISIQDFDLNQDLQV